MAKALQHPRLEKAPKAIKRRFERCPRCGHLLRATPSFAGPPSTFFKECSNPKCNTYVNTYIPQAHQEAVHQDSHTYVGNFGGYGTGKTLTSQQEILKHILITPGANVLIGANVTSQYEQTLKRELEANLPAQFVADSSAQNKYFDLHNGARVLFRPFDDADKLRSYNLTMFVMIEASEIKAEAYHQLKTRLRNTAATLPFLDEHGDPVLEYDDRGIGVPKIQYDWRRGIIESNPDSGWVRTDVLLPSEKIHKHGHVADEYDQVGLELDPAIATHVASTDSNRFLPPNFIRELCANKPGWWVARYVYGSFAYSEGLVYPTAMKHVCQTFEIPPEWRRIVAFDYGLNDDSVFLFGAVDPKHGILYIYKEVRVNNRNIDELAALYFKHSADIPAGGLICQPLIDPKSGAQRDYNKDSLSDLFLKKGIHFKPGYISLDARIYRLNTYFESGRLKIMDCCQGLLGELREYKFKPRTLERKVGQDKPEDKNNHGINPLEWITMELPEDPRNIIYGIYNRYGQDVTRINPQQRWLPHALQDDPGYTDPYAAYGMDTFHKYF